MVMKDAPEHTSHGSNSGGSNHCNLRHNEKTLQEKHPLNEYLREDTISKRKKDDTFPGGNNDKHIMLHV